MKEVIESEGNYFCKGCLKMKDYSDDVCDCDEVVVYEFGGQNV